MQARLAASLLLFVFLLGACGGSKKPFNRYQQGEFETAVVRDPLNQPSITVRKAPAGQADLALVEAQGYNEAADRFHQMDILRRSSTGRLAEVFGPAAVA